MTKEQFQQWAMAVVVSVEEQRESADQFAAQLEEHDPEAAALLRKNTEASRALADHLKSNHSH